MTGKKPSHADVQVIQREVDLPSSRSARRDKIRSDLLENSAASGGTQTGTIATNNSSQNWLLFSVSSTVDESVAPGDVSLEIKVKDSDGNLVYGGAGDLSGTQPISFGEGGIVREGWTIDYRIVNNSSSTATFHLYPYLSRSSVDDIGSSTGDGTTVDPDTHIDDFERTNVRNPYTYTNYSGTTNDKFAEETGNIYEGTKALKFEGTSDTEVFLSMPGDGLSNYPSLGDKWSIRFNPEVIDSSVYRFGILFGMDSTIDNGYLLRLSPGGSACTLYKLTDGSSETLGSVSQRFDDPEFYRAQVEGKDPLDIVFYDKSGNKLSSVTADNPSPRHDNGGFGYWIEGFGNSTDKVIADDAKMQ